MTYILKQCLAMNPWLNMRASSTCSDIIFNLSNHDSLLTRAAAFVLGNWQPGATILEHTMMQNRELARKQVDRMLQWPADKIILAHGPIIEENGREVLRKAYERV